MKVFKDVVLIFLKKIKRKIYLLEKSKDSNKNIINYN